MPNQIAQGTTGQALPWQTQVYLYNAGDSREGTWGVYPNDNNVPVLSSQPFGWNVTIDGLITVPFNGRTTDYSAVIFQKTGVDSSGKDIVQANTYIFNVVPPSVIVNPPIVLNVPGAESSPSNVVSVTPTTAVSVIPPVIINSYVTIFQALRVFEKCVRIG